MKANSILVFVVSTAISISAASAFDLRIGDTHARRIAKSSSIPGKNLEGACLPYAVELNKKLRAAGIESRVIGYHYKDLTIGGRRLGQTRGHAVVAYNDRGRAYIMDNQSWMPRWVEKAPARAMVSQFGGMDLQVDKAWVVGKHHGPGSGIDEASRRALSAKALSRNTQLSTEFGA